jgi:phosphate transport system substrate-binding protein
LKPAIETAVETGMEAAQAAASQASDAVNNAVNNVVSGDDSVSIDPELVSYEPRERVSGSLKFAGSDTMTNLVALWVQSFNQVHPAVKPQSEAKGSSTAPPALIEGQAQFGAMSREMKPEEIQKFVEEFGFEPTQLRVAIDAIGLFVNKDNPIEFITLDQLAEVFSVTGGDLTWGDMGVSDPSWANLPVSLYGRNEASGTYAFFQKVGLGGADYKPTVKAQPGSAGVVGAISNDRGGLGYSGLGYRTADIRILPVAIDEYSDAVTATPETVSSGEYPLARFLYMYLRHDRREAIDPLRAEFIRMVFSRQGQESVVQDGVYPITANLAREQLRVPRHRTRLLSSRCSFEVSVRISVFLAWKFCRLSG